MSTEGRAMRVAELVKAEIGGLLTKGLKDPRIGFVSIMGVKMSSDLRYAKVYVSFYGTEKQKKSSLIGLKQASGWIRRELGRNLRLRLTPEVRFFEDDSLDRVYELEKIIKTLHENETETNDEPD